MNHKKWTVVLIIAIIFLPMLVIHFLFKIHSNYYWIEAEWKPGEVLGYFGDILSFVGTVVLGYIAIMQTEKANQLNGELLKIEKNRIKPCLEILPLQSYKIYFADDMDKKVEKIDVSDTMVMNLLYTADPRTGITTPYALIKLEVLNSGFSDIRRIQVKKSYTYLSVSDPYQSSNEEIAIMGGNTCLKVDEKKQLYIIIEYEISEDELYCDWDKASGSKLIPHLEFEFELETVTGNLYSEKIICGSSWNINMKDTQNLATRVIGSVDINVNEIAD